RLRFWLPEAGRSSAPGRQSGVTKRPSSSDTMSAAGARFAAEELSALNQFMSAAVEAGEPAGLARVAVPALFYQTGASLVGLFNLAPSNPVPKVIWPEAGRVDEQMARQLTRRVHRDHRAVWLAEDTVATLPGTAVTQQATYADAIGLPLKAGGKVFG